MVRPPGDCLRASIHNQREVKISMGSEIAPVAGDMPGVLEFVFPVTGDSVRTIEVDGKLKFVGVDLAKAMGYASAKDALRSVRDKNKGRHIVPTPSGQQECLCVDEPGLYQLIMASRSDKAEIFQDWITDEVIPSIRKTGSYSSKPKSNIDMLVETALEMQRVEKQQIELDRQQRELEKRQIETRFELLEQAVRIDHQQQQISRHDAQLDSLNNRTGCLTILAWWKQRGITESLTMPLAAKLGKQVTAVYRQRFGKEPHKVLNDTFGYVNQYPETLLDELLGAFVS